MGPNNKNKSCNHSKIAAALMTFATEFAKVEVEERLLVDSMVNATFRQLGEGPKKGEELEGVASNASRRGQKAYVSSDLTEEEDWNEEAGLEKGSDVGRVGDERGVVSLVRRRDKKANTHLDLKEQEDDHEEAEFGKEGGGKRRGGASAGVSERGNKIIGHLDLLPDDYDKRQFPPRMDEGSFF